MTAHSASCQLGSTALSSLLRSFIKEALKHGLHSSDIGYIQDMHTQSRWCERQDVWIMHALMHCCFPFITYNYVQTLLFAHLLVLSRRPDTQRTLTIAQPDSLDTIKSIVQPLGRSMDCTITLCSILPVYLYFSSPCAQQLPDILSSHQQSLAFSRTKIYVRALDQHQNSYLQPFSRELWHEAMHSTVLQAVAAQKP